MLVVSKGSVKVKIGGINQVLSDVYYIPDLKNNFLSIGKLQEKGLAILFRNGECKVFHPTRGVIMQSKMSKNIMLCLTVVPTATNSMCLQAKGEAEKEA